MTGTRMIKLTGGADAMRYAVILALVGCVLLTSTVSAAAGDLVIHVAELRNGAGNIRFALHNNPDEFPEGKRYDGMEVAAHEGTVTAIFKDLPAGIYALAIHHDEDKDDEMDTILFGIPQEGYGFSNDARVIFGPPSFEAASFEVLPEGAEITLKLRY